MEKKSEGQLTFELKDLSYEELITVYNDINDFIKYLDNLESELEKNKTEEKKKGE